MVVAQQVRVLVEDHAEVARAAGYPDGVVGRLQAGTRLAGLINRSLSKKFNKMIYLQQLKSENQENKLIELLQAI